MSIQSFQVFCIECYSRHTQQSSPDVFRLFQSTGLLNMLKDDYEDLHGLGMEALIQFRDDFSSPLQTSYFAPRPF